MSGWILSRNLSKVPGVMRKAVKKKDSLGSLIYLTNLK